MIGVTLIEPWVTSNDIKYSHSLLVYSNLNNPDEVEYLLQIINDKTSYVEDRENTILMREHYT